jgi:hypothetical protein
VNESKYEKQNTTARRIRAKLQRLQIIKPGLNCLSFQPGGQLIGHSSHVTPCAENRSGREDLGTKTEQASCSVSLY